MNREIELLIKMNALKEVELYLQQEYLKIENALLLLQSEPTTKEEKES